MTDRDGPVAEAIADLAGHTGVDPDDIEVVAHQEVTWRDGSMGCPQPGMMYTQALVDGYRIVLRAAGVEYFYHGANGEPPFRCDNPDRNGALGAHPTVTLGHPTRGERAGTIGTSMGPARRSVTYNF